MFCISDIFFFKQKTAYEMRISDWSSDVCSSDLRWGGPAVCRGARSQGEKNADSFRPVHQRKLGACLKQYRTIGEFTMNRRHRYWPGALAAVVILAGAAALTRGGFFAPANSPTGDVVAFTGFANSSIHVKASLAMTGRTASSPCTSDATGPST